LVVDAIGRGVSGNFWKRAAPERASKRKALRAKTAGARTARGGSAWALVLEGAGPSRRQAHAKAARDSTARKWRITLLSTNKLGAPGPR
jgi:hypothetical protein